MLTMRPNLRAIMPSSVALISAIGASMLPSSALIQSSRSNFRKSPGGGPPALLMRMSGAGHAARMASRPSFVVTSATTVLGRLPVADAISSAARSEEHTSELQSLRHLVCRLLLEKKNKQYDKH